MKGRTPVTAVILLLSCLRISALDIAADPYTKTVDFLIDLYGIDENAALTAFRSLYIPMGGTSEGMGTAYSAVADDASFLEWNPAGSATLKKTELSFFHNNWIADTKIEGAVYAERRGDLGFALGGKWLYLPFTEYDQYGDRASKGFYAETTGIANLSYNFFRGYYFDGISVGMNAKTAFRSMPDYSDDAGYVDPDSGNEQSTFAFMIDAGALIRFNALKYYYARERNAAASLVVRNLGPAPLGDPLPTTTTVGLSYHPIRPVVLAFDYSVPINLVDPALSENPYWAAGVSVAVSQYVSMQTGLMIRGTNPRITMGSKIAVSGIDLNVNYTLDLLTRLQPLNRVSLSVRFDFGDRGRSARAERVDYLYLKGLEEYAGGNTEEAARLWQEALKLDPKFDPAREGLGSVLGLHDLVKKMDEIQRLE
jgi:tetratricopeptide (TPR) repeat protein